MARKADQEEVEEQEDEVPEEEGQEFEDEGGTSISITGDTITVEVPRDGNEGETLTRLAKLVDGLGQ